MLCNSTPLNRYVCGKNGNNLQAVFSRKQANVRFRLAVFAQLYFILFALLLVAQTFHPQRTCTCSFRKCAANLRRSKTFISAVNIHSFAVQRWSYVNMEICHSHWSVLAPLNSCCRAKVLHAHSRRLFVLWISIQGLIRTKNVRHLQSWNFCAFPHSTAGCHAISFVE